MTAAVKVKGGAEQETSGKSGLRRLKPAEVLFNDGEAADSLFIIQKGQIRLFKPKGKGFVEIAVLRAGEVLGEMAYFDNNSAGGGKRSCSAAALVPSEAIEISFNAFAKTMAGLNPWFKTIINTLAERLRKTNSRVRELESNQVSSYGSKKGYTFLRNADVVKILSIVFLTVKSHGEDKEGLNLVHKNTLRFYTNDVFNLQEVQVEEMLSILENLGHMEVMADKNGHPKIMAFKNLPHLRSLLVFFNSQRTVADEKKLDISFKGEMFLSKILEALTEEADKGIAVAEVKLDPIIEEFKRMAITMTIDDLESAQKAKLVGDIIIDDGVMTTTIQIADLRSQFPSIQLLNAIKKVNEARDGKKY